MMHRAAMATIGLILWGVAASANEGDASRLAISLQNVRWQPLPKEIRCVHVSPDGRAWLVRGWPGAVSSVDDIKKHIESEYKQPMPQLRNVQPLLFEPSGRVWFSIINGQDPKGVSLLGYDGQQWIEYSAELNHQLFGECLTQGAFVQPTAHRYAGNAAWFVGRNKILRFDGKTWQEELIAPPEDHSSCMVRLATSPNGQIAVAWTMNNRRLWIYQQGQWAKDPLVLDSLNSQVQDLVITDACELYLWNGHQLQVLALEEAVGKASAIEKAKGRFSEKIAALADDRAETWQRAFDDLKAMGLSISPQIEKILNESASSTSADRLKMQYRLRTLLQALRSLPHDASGSGMTTLGSFKLSHVTGIRQDAGGRIFVQANIVVDNERRSANRNGLLAIETNGTVHQYEGVNLTGLYAIQPVLAIKNQIWWQCMGPTMRPRLLDLASKKWIASIPGPQHLKLHAATPDGRLFVSKDNSTIMAYTPGAPENRGRLSVEKISLKGPVFTIADDGAIWTIHDEKGLVRFENGQWKQPADQSLRFANWMTAGTDGVVFLRSDNKAYLYQGDKKIDSGLFAPLLEKNRDTICRAFGPGSPAFDCRVQTEQDWRFAADRQGNVWYAMGEGNLSVLIGKHRHSAWQSSKTGDKQIIHVKRLIPLGDGRKMCIAGWPRNNPGQERFALGEVKGEKIEISLLPQQNVFGTLRDTENCLWISGGANIRGSFTPTIFHLGSEGVLEERQQHCRPVLADAAGNVWLDLISSDAVRLWRNKNWDYEIAIPGLLGGTMMVSDRPGSVYAATVMGLQHLVADGPAFDRFRLDKIYSLDEAEGEIIGLEYSKTGGIVLVTRTQSSSQKHFLYRFALKQAKP